MSVWRCAIAVCAAWPMVARAQAPVVSTTTAVVTRADLAAAYLRLDHVTSTKIMDDSTRAAVSRAFDKSTLNFFGGRFSVAVTTIDSLTVALSGAAIAPTPVLKPRVLHGQLPSVTRDALFARLAKIDSTGLLAQAVVSARARAALLVDVPSSDRSAEFLSEPSALANDVDREVSLLEKGKNPYTARVGDVWRTYRGANGAFIPFRLVASAAVVRAKQPVPMLIVLHGAGGDENMFIDAYGAGITSTLAKNRGVLLVSPATTAFAASPENLDVLLSMLRSEYRVDNARIYLLGHSMGAGAVARLTQQRPNVIAATVCLAGGSAVTVPNAPPMLFIGAELDPIIPAKAVQAAAIGTPSATYQLALHEGHTMMVRNGVLVGVPWLLERHR